MKIWQGVAVGAGILRCLVLGLPLLALAPSLADAHAIVVEASPALGSTVGGPDLQATIRFNSRIDLSRSSLTLTGPDGVARVFRPILGGEPNIMRVSLAGLIAGAYTMRWQVLSVDGHITRGDIPFTISAP